MRRSKRNGGKWRLVYPPEVGGDDQFPLLPLAHAHQALVPPGRRALHHPAMVPPWCHHAPFTIVCHHHFHSPLDHPTSPQLEVEGLAPGVRGEKVEVKGAKLG